MRVLYVESPEGFGGSLTGLLHLFQALPADVEPLLVTSFDPAPYIDLPASLIHRQARIPARSKATGHWTRRVTRYFWQDVFPLKRELDRLLKEFQPDLVHANNSVTVNLAAAWSARKRGIPSISHQKGFEHQGRFSRWVVQRCGFTHHIATSGAIADHLVSLGLPPERCTTIYEPVVGPTDSRWEQPRNNPIPVVGMHSVLGHWKGQHILLRAVAKTLQRGRAQLRVEIAGTSPGGDSDYLNELRQLVSDLHIGEHVRFVGHVKDVYGFLATVDFAVHASIAPEPFGRVVAEAMLCGLPSIVTTEGGPAEYVEHGVTGIHVPCNQVDAMADAIELLATSHEMRREMGRKARAYAVAEFDPHKLTQQVVDVYRRLLDRSERGREASATSRSNSSR